MKEIDLFLKALENTLNNKRGCYISNTCTLDCKFPAYKQMIAEVWCIDGDYKTLISKVDITEKSTTKEEYDQLKSKVIQATFENILRYYGI